ncbi:MAG: TIGR01906 family membrane protein [Lachnospiraceae bacterium]|nr:TIGR01906 family membrane protein [Lachnospiraceae bacterium]
MKTNKPVLWLTNFAIGVLFLIFFISLGLAIAIYVRPFYYMGMELISAETGYSTEVIKENYDALIDYCSPFFTGELDFPSLPESESGISHFVEVKVIFNLFFALLFITPIFLAGLIFLQAKRNNTSWMLTSPIIVCVLPLLIGLACAIDFNRIFVLFHQIVFNNDDWIFSPLEDPIILFLPERFFLQCALIIVGTVLLGCVILLTLYFLHKNKQKKLVASHNS